MPKAIKSFGGKWKDSEYFFLRELRIFTVNRQFRCGTLVWSLMMEITRHVNPGESGFMSISRKTSRDDDGENSPLMGDISLASALGVEEDFAPDHLSPPVDADLLRQFIRNELVGIDLDQVAELIAGFRPWRDGLKQMLQEEFREISPSD